MITLLFWDDVNKQLIEWDGSTDADSIPDHLMLLPCIDKTTNHVPAKYGYYKKVYIGNGWQSLKMDELPKELLTYSLILP